MSELACLIDWWSWLACWVDWWVYLLVSLMSVLACLLASLMSLLACLLNWWVYLLACLLVPLTFLKISKPMWDGCIPIPGLAHWWLWHHRQSQINRPVQLTSSHSVQLPYIPRFCLVSLRSIPCRIRSRKALLGWAILVRRELLILESL